MQDDWLMIEQVHGGNREAYAHLVNKYKDRLYSFLYRMTGQSQDAQDLTQEVFLKAYCSLDKYKPTDAFLAWLYRIVSNLCVDAWRKSKRYSGTPLEESLLIETETPLAIFCNCPSPRFRCESIMPREICELVLRKKYQEVLRSMKCSRADALRAYMNGKLSEKESRLLERHVKDCLS